jgi:hypothetical protein
MKNTLQTSHFGLGWFWPLWWACALIALVFTLISCASAQTFNIAQANIGSINGAGGGGGVSYLLEENFETGVAPSGWTVAGTGWSWTTAGLQGTYCAQSQEWGAETIYKDFASQTDIYGYFLFKYTSTGTEVELRDSANAMVARVYISSTGQIFMGNKDFDGPGWVVNTMTAGVTYHIFYHYKASATAGVLDVGFSTDGTLPALGDNRNQKTTCTVNVAVERLAVVDSGGANTATLYDRMLLLGTQIENNP